MLIKEMKYEVKKDKYVINKNSVYFALTEEQVYELLEVLEFIISEEM